MTRDTKSCARDAAGPLQSTHVALARADASMKHWLAGAPPLKPWVALTNHGGVRRFRGRLTDDDDDHTSGDALDRYLRGRERFMKRLDAGIRAFLTRRPNAQVYDNANVIWDSYVGVWDEDLR
jgi:hypothetical protein